MGRRSERFENAPLAKLPPPLAQVVSYHADIHFGAEIQITELQQLDLRWCVMRAAKQAHRAAPFTGQLDGITIATAFKHELDQKKFAVSHWASQWSDDENMAVLKDDHRVSVIFRVHKRGSFQVIFCIAQGHDEARNGFGPGQGGPPPHNAPAHGPPAHGAPAQGLPAHGPPALGLPVQGPPARGLPVQGPPAHGAPAPGLPARNQGPPPHGAPVQGPPAHGPPAHGSPAPGVPARGPPAPGVPPRNQGAPHRRFSCAPAPGSGQHAMGQSADAHNASSGVFGHGRARSSTVGGADDMLGRAGQHVGPAPAVQRAVGQCGDVHSAAARAIGRGQPDHGAQAALDEAFQRGVASVAGNGSALPMWPDDDDDNDNGDDISDDNESRQLARRNKAKSVRFVAASQSQPDYDPLPPQENWHPQGGSKCP